MPVSVSLCVTWQRQWQNIPPLLFMCMLAKAMAEYSSTSLHVHVPVFTLCDLAKAMAEYSSTSLHMPVPVSLCVTWLRQWQNLPPLLFFSSCACVCVTLCDLAKAMAESSSTSLHVPVSVSLCVTWLRQWQNLPPLFSLSNCLTHFKHIKGSKECYLLGQDKTSKFSVYSPLSSYKTTNNI